jgi:hypothetical protein
VDVYAGAGACRDFNCLIGLGLSMVVREEGIFQSPVVLRRVAIIGEVHRMLQIECSAVHLERFHRGFDCSVMHLCRLLLRHLLEPSLLAGT